MRVNKFDFLPVFEGQNWVENDANFGGFRAGKGTSTYFFSLEMGSRDSYGHATTDSASIVGQNVEEPVGSCKDVPVTEFELGACKVNISSPRNASPTCHS